MENNAQNHLCSPISLHSSHLLARMKKRDAGLLSSFGWDKNSCTTQSICVVVCTSSMGCGIFAALCTHYQSPFYGFFFPFFFLFVSTTIPHALQSLLQIQLTTNLAPPLNALDFSFLKTWHMSLTLSPDNPCCAAFSPCFSAGSKWELEACLASGA